jgi:hypothetical protein
MSDPGSGTAPTEPPEPVPAPGSRRDRWARSVWAWLIDRSRFVRDYFRDQDPTFWVAITPALILAALLFVRSPASNYIFDEQEALLANPYVNGKDLGLLEAFKRDFWGLPPTRTIGSYRPIPNLIWRALWHVSQAPWLHHWVNVVVHAINGTLVARFAWAMTRRRAVGWLAGASFLMSAVITEAVSGVVGIADVLGGLGVLLGLMALLLPMWAMPWAVLGATLFGLFSKESCVVAVPLLGWAALVTAPSLHPERPWRGLRALLALGAAAGALVGYTYFRRHFFPVSLPPEFERPLEPGASWQSRGLHEFMRWFHQPKLPSDGINNPLINASSYSLRVAGALRVFWGGVVQVFFPWTLSGDYSFPQEPVPVRALFPESVLGAVVLLGAPLAGVGAWLRAISLGDRAFWRRFASGEPIEARSHWRITQNTLFAVGLVWAPVAYFPHSNIPVLLPTVRAERFWYLPVIGSALVVAALGTALHRHLPWRRVALGLLAAFFGFQGLRARWHALDYTDDLMFWDATRHAAPNSAKAQLNYSVMVGARGRMSERLEANGRAKELAPEWPMAHIYYGDTLCRMGRPDEAWPHYLKGFELAPNDSNLIALSLQCLWDHGAIKSRSSELLDLADDEKNHGSWLAYLAREIVTSGDKNGGVEKKYRPRGYNEGPQD